MSDQHDAVNQRGQDERHVLLSRRAATWKARRCASASALFATVTTDAGGAVYAMHDSFLPLGGMVLLVNMALGEVTFGGVGSGLYGMLAFAIVTMFVAGLMVGRTPEFSARSSMPGRSR
jgi:K+-transporting ATPase A subunit